MKIANVTYVGNVHEHRKHEIEICSGVPERFSHLVPLPRIVSDPLSVTSDSIDSDGFLPIIEPSDLQLRIGKSVSVK
jgi:hypothetical protein